MRESSSSLPHSRQLHVSKRFPDAPRHLSTGKSSLINALRADGEREAKAALSEMGVTKEITEYRGRPINGQPLLLLDTPGVGDGDVTPAKLLSLVERELCPEAGHRKLDGVIVTTPAGDGRVKLGAQV